MKELLEDPQTIPFKQGTTLSLTLLKKEIDRRISKIKTMLGCHPTSIRHPSIINQGCQTLTISQSQAIDQSRVLALVQQTTKPVFKQNMQKMKRCSLPMNKSNHKKETTINCLQDSYRKIRIIDYLSSQKPNNCHQIQQSHRRSSECSDRFSNEKKFIQTSQDQKIFSSQDFEQFSEIYAQTMKISFNFDVSDQECKTSDNDSSGSNIGQRRLSTIGRQTHSNKKIKFTDRTAPEQENRIVVSQECKNRILDLVSQFATRKRREGLDNKVRQNLIKKIDDKFGVNDSF